MKFVNFQNGKNWCLKIRLEQKVGFSNRGLYNTYQYIAENGPYGEQPDFLKNRLYELAGF